METRCHDCRFWNHPESHGVRRPGGADIRTGECRRHAPTAAGWVWTNYYSWCGEFQADDKPSRAWEYTPKYFGARLSNILESSDLLFLWQLDHMSEFELRKIPGIGKKSIDKIYAYLRGEKDA